MNLTHIRYFGGLSLFLLLFTVSCSQNKKKKAEGGTADPIDISQITYQEFYELMFESYDNRVEWHQNLYIDEAKSSVQLVEKGKCDEDKPGNKVFVENISEQDTVKVVVETTFSIPNAPKYLATEFILAPGEERHLSCTSFQYSFKGADEDVFILNHEIVIAQKVTD